MPRAPAVVTVLMSVHNDAAYIAESVGSVLAQTWGDFEFLIVDDGSTDGSGDYLSGLTDPRVRLIRNARNLGLTRSLNLGLYAATGTFVVRMDADDVAEPDRLARQVAFLRGHPEVGIVGTGRTLIDAGGAVVGRATPALHDLSIRWKSLLGNPFAHPTVMLRRDVLERHRLRYDPAYRTAQDYELWTRLLRHTRGANLPDPLLRYRLRPDGISGSRRADQLANHDRIAAGAIRRLVPGFPVSDAEATGLRGRYGGFSVREPGMDSGDPVWRAKWLALLNAFVQAHRDRPGIDVFRDEQARTVLARAA